MPGGMAVKPPTEGEHSYSYRVDVVLLGVAKVT